MVAVGPSDRVLATAGPDAAAGPGRAHRRAGLRRHPRPPGPRGAAARLSRPPGVSLDRRRPGRGASRRRRVPPGEWIVLLPPGEPPFHLAPEQSLAERRFPDRHDLDAAAPDQPGLAPRGLGAVEQHAALRPRPEQRRAARVRDHPRHAAAHLDRRDRARLGQRRADRPRPRAAPLARRRVHHPSRRAALHPRGARAGAARGDAAQRGGGHDQRLRGPRRRRGGAGRPTRSCTTRASRPCAPTCRSACRPGGRLARRRPCWPTGRTSAGGRGFGDDWLKVGRRVPRVRRPRRGGGRAPRRVAVHRLGGLHRPVQRPGRLPRAVPPGRAPPTACGDRRS